MGEIRRAEDGYRRTTYKEVFALHSKPPVAIFTLLPSASLPDYVFDEGERNLPKLSQKRPKKEVCGRLSSFIVSRADCSFV